jgi:GNAT superfamily N-acetyltransferase
VSRSVVPLSADHLDRLPARCGACLFWELGRPRPDPTIRPDEDELAGDARVQKGAWITAQTLDGFPPGRVVLRDGQIAAFALFGAPGTFARRRQPVPPASDDALFLATIRVDAAARGGGLGKLLLRESIRAAIEADLRAVEAYADRRYRDHDCVLPSQWLLHHGFEVHAEHPRYPLLRLEVKRTLRWAESLEQALDEILERMPRRVPLPQQAPVPRSGSTRVDR